MLHRMQERVRAARANESGFTLIELLIVIVILGVLAGVVVFSVQFINSRGEKAACQTDRKDVEVAVEAFRAQKSVYPTAIYNKDDPADATTLVGLGVIKEAPSSSDYTITYDADTHAVTGVLAGGGAC